MDRICFANIKAISNSFADIIDIGFCHSYSGVIWSLWAFASMAAAIHGFQSTILTFFVGLGLSLLILTLFNIVY